VGGIRQKQKELWIAVPKTSKNKAFSGKKNWISQGFQNQRRCLDPELMGEPLVNHHGERLKGAAAELLVS
jgi:hypothetical protein